VTEQNITLMTSNRNWNGRARPHRDMQSRQCYQAALLRITQPTKT